MIPHAASPKVVLLIVTGMVVDSWSRGKMLGMESFLNFMQNLGIQRAGSPLVFQRIPEW